MSLPDSVNACKKNLSELSEREKKILLCRKVHIAEAVRQYFNGVRFDNFLNDSDEIRQKYNEFCKEFSDCDGYGDIGFLLTVCDAVGNTVGLPKSAEGFCRLLSAQRPQSARISCMRGAICDEAFDRFSQILEGACVVYADSFSDVCENLYHSHSDYAILPVENTSEGILSGFVSLIAKYELFISMVYSAERESDMSRTTYALLSKNALPAYGEGKITFAAEIVSEKSCAEFISCLCDFYKAEIRQMQIIELNNARYRTRCRFLLDERVLSLFATALVMNVPGTEIRGVYREI